MLSQRITYLFHAIILSTLLLASVNLRSQSETHDLKNEKRRLEKSIEYADYLIKDAHKRKNTTLQGLALLQSKIDSRQQLIDNYLKEQNLTFDTIFATMLKINKIGSELDELKGEYALMVNSAYKNHNTYKRLVYVLSAGSLNQAYSRFNYYKYYARRRNSQIEQIRNVENSYFEVVEKLDEKIKQNELLIADVNEEYTKLDHEKQLKKKIVQNLNARMMQLRADQEENKKAALTLEAKIEETLNSEGMDKANTAAKPQLLNMPTPERELISTGFQENYGALPWPIKRGIISGYFGEQDHPELEDIKIRNNGINFLTNEGAEARSVFKGEVTRVLSVPNFNNVVILRHGDFLSVYSNLSEVFVKPGMQIETKQAIGTVFTDKDNSRTELHFEIWNGKEKLDPARWIASIQAQKMQAEDDNP